MYIPKIEKLLFIPKKLKDIKPQRLTIVPNFRMEADFYDIRLNNKNIGNATFSLKMHEVVTAGLKKVLPDSWYTDKAQERLKPYLELSYIEILQSKKMGLGRKAMQILFNISNKNGAEGRMVLTTGKHTAGFYSHLGFDCSKETATMYDSVYDELLSVAKEKQLSRSEFLKLLKSKACPVKYNKKYNVAGIRFFNPTEENMSCLFKK